MAQRNDTAIWSGLFRISAESGQTLQAQIRQVIFNRKEEMLRAAFSETARNKAQINNYLAERLLESVGKANAAAAGATPKADAKKDEPKSENKADEKK